MLVQHQEKNQESKNETIQHLELELTRLMKQLEEEKVEKRTLQEQQNQKDLTILQLQSLQENLQKQINQQEETIKLQQDQLGQVQSSLNLFVRDVEEIQHQHLSHDSSSPSSSCVSSNLLKEGKVSFDCEEFSHQLSAFTKSWVEVKTYLHSAYQREKLVTGIESQFQNIIEQLLSQQVIIKRLTDERVSLFEEIEELKLQLKLSAKDYQDLSLQKEKQEQLYISLSKNAAIPAGSMPIPELGVHTELLSTTLQSALIVFSRELLELSQIYNQGKVLTGKFPVLNTELSKDHLGMTFDPSMISDYLSSLLQLWPELKQSILNEHQELTKKDQEYREIVQQLIVSKLRVAEVTTELDVQKKRSNDLRRENRRYRVSNYDNGTNYPRIESG